MIAGRKSPFTRNGRDIDCLFPLQLTMHPKELENNKWTSGNSSSSTPLLKVMAGE